MRAPALAFQGWLWSHPVGLGSRSLSQSVRSRENRAIPWNLPAQLVTHRGLLLSHELLYSKAKLSPSAEKVTGRQGPAGTDTSPSSAFPKGHQAAGRAFPMVTGQGKVVLPPPLCSAGLHITGGLSQC